MTEEPKPDAPPPQAKVPPESLRLRARPAPVTTINRKVLIGGAAVLLTMIACIVLIALQPPSFRAPSGTELFNVDHKPISDGLAKLPSTYDGVQGPAPADAVPGIAAGTGKLQTAKIDPAIEAERVEKVRLARMAGQAREAPVFFRLQLKPAPRETTPSEQRRDSTTVAGPKAGEGQTASLSALRPADRTRTSGGTDTETPATDSTEPTRKLAFLTSGPEKDIYNPHRLQTPVSPYQLLAGTIIAASLVSGLNSDLPGFVIAQVTENVFDSVSGRFLLIPQGSRLIGKYDNVVAFGQDRALVVWQRIILPDGSSVVIDNLPATDTGGYAGLADEVDLHTWQLLKGVALATVLGIGNSLAFGSTNNDSDLVKALRESTGQTTNRAGQRLVEKTLNVQPTITVRPGWPLRIIVHKDLVLRPYRQP